MKEMLKKLADRILRHHTRMTFTKTTTTQQNNNPAQQEPHRTSHIENVTCINFYL